MKKAMQPLVKVLFFVALIGALTVVMIYVGVIPTYEKLSFWKDKPAVCKVASVGGECACNLASKACPANQLGIEHNKCPPNDFPNCDNQEKVKNYLSSQTKRGNCCYEGIQAGILS
ncbi:hypothetical protein ACFL0V_04765 [Nanoarchaeota archaeon]